MFCFLVSYKSYAEEDLYFENESTSEYVETSKEDDMIKKKTETQKYQYDIEVYPYVSIKYTSVRVKEEDIFIDDVL
jgi:hypothetical protein